MYYTLALDIRRMPCLIVGAGAVGLRKAQGLLKAGAQDVLVLDKGVSAESAIAKEWEALCESTCVRFECREFTDADVHGKRLVFTCTSQRQLNAHIAALCAQRGILCNCTDAPLEGDCIVPAVARVDAGENGNTRESAISAALMTDGASPAWSRVLREELEEWLRPHLPMTRLLGRLRPLVLALQKETGHNTTLFRALVQSPLRHALAQKDEAQCVALLQNILPMSLHRHIAELLYGLI